MAKLLMITGLGSAVDLASSKKGAFYNTLEEFHKYWTRIDIICPRINNINSGNSKLETLNPKQSQNYKSQTINLFGNVFVHISPWPLILHPIFFIYKILKLHRTIKFDLMTVQEFPPFYNGIGSWIISVLTKIPYVLEIHHIPGYPKAANLKDGIYRNLMKWFIKFDASTAIAVRVVNKKQTPEFLIKAGVPEKKVVYISSMYIDLDIFKPMGLPKEYDLIFVGRLESNKGIDLLLKAIHFTVYSLQFTVKCLVVGEGPLSASLKFKVRSLKLENYVIFHGWAKSSQEIAELINRSKILIMPSYNEGGPRVVIEAMACGVPVLATPVGIVPDLLNKNLFVGRQVASGGEIIDWRPEDIAQKAQELLNLERCGKYSFNGLEIVKQFEKKKAIKNYADKLKEILG